MSDAPPETPGWAPPDGAQPPMPPPPPPMWGAPGAAQPYQHPSPYVPPTGPPGSAVPLAPRFGSRRWWACVVAVVAMIGTVIFIGLTADRSDPTSAYGPGLAAPTYIIPGSGAPTAPSPSGGPAEVEVGDVQRLRLCSSIGPVDVSMPSPVKVDGPRALANIPAPASGTFATSYSDDRVLRADAIVIEGAGGLYPSDEVALPAVASNLDGDPAAVRMVTPADRGGAMQLNFAEDFDGRTYSGYAIAFHGVIVVLEVGTPPESAGLLRATRDDLLGQAVRSLGFPGPDVPCEASG